MSASGRPLARCRCRTRRRSRSSMSVSVTMPRLGESVSEGTVTRWLKQEGERVEADEPLLEVSTDKVDTEIPAPASGVISSIKVSEDETVEVGVELAVIDDGSAAAAPAEAPAAEAPAAEPEPEPEPAKPAAAIPPPAPAPAPPAPAPAQPAPAPAAAANGDGGIGRYVTPLVRKMAAELGVELGDVNGTGPGGRITKQDIQDAARTGGAAPAPAPAPRAPAPAAAPARTAPQAPPAATTPAATPVRGRTEKLTRLRALVARRMVESLQISAQLTTVVEVDVTRIARLRDRAKAGFQAREGLKLSFLPFFALATCEALREFPQLNASIDVDAGTVTYHGEENLGIAVDSERGLVVPVAHNAGDLNLTGLARKIDDLASRTRSNKISPDELGGGTFTLTNTGSRGALFDTPILNQPQVGILGTGIVTKKPAVIDDPDLGEVIAVRSSVYLSLTYDHRIVDGADAARFLTFIKRRLEEGAFEADLGL
ncbi:2-oxoglutarate dehydrogenase, E2 component, dihydrolipoamide succinyltransferase [Frankia sp. AgB32]|uniref:2-oxoglutarate dehydrogenase, E2 component, dihydrolipoamide succinyltransferase n=1 Tax=Frankia sp. AgB32 TaxID=631119 RepID=UPI0027E2F758|nr:2-oxoglutarate dehydrogenase, E2 component, dihydrolipoamide succinyltransferase [Frankia sp. AgB32]